MATQGVLAQGLVYLSAAVIAVPVFKRLGLGSVLGYLCAGAAIGPWGLALVRDPEAILHFAEFGVALLLFLVGLELNAQRLWQLRVPILGMGNAQVIVTIAVVALLGISFRTEWRFALVAGMGFAMSSTAIALQTLAEKNLLGTPGGQAGVSVLLFQDIAVIPLMLVLGLLSAGAESSSMDWQRIGTAIGLILGIIAVGRYLLRHVLRYVASTGSREIFIAFSLLLVIGTALLMQSVGLSMALGTFLAGVILGESEYRHELEMDIEPFKGLLLGLFFIAVGMSVDMGLFASRPMAVAGLACGVVVLKIVLLLALARAFKLSSQDGWLFGLVLSQVGEFAFVLFGVALSEQVISKDQANLLNAAVAASMMTTPLLMLLHQHVLSPRLNRAQPVSAGTIEDRHPVIVAGFGRVGQVVTRVLTARGFKVTLIEHDPNQIERVRRFGWKAYYGDVTRLDLLGSAGAATAQLIVLAIDDADQALRAARLIREHFPSVRLVVRAQSRTDAYEWVELGIPFVRETFGSALTLAERALVSMGVPAYSAKRAAQQFQRHDEALIESLASQRHDQKTLISANTQARSDLEQLLQSEGGARVSDKEAGWH
ncbi:MAG: glutathione-regulated potassium-efflux system protein KefC [Betaproteobacteria bacterium]|nr:glutathione-regulated potassium-efflux system protein KefC [Betaproteobacteria bacterium]